MYFSFCMERKSLKHYTCIITMDYFRILVWIICGRKTQKHESWNVFGKQRCTSVDPRPRSDRRWPVNVQSSLGSDLLLLGSGRFSIRNSLVRSRANGSTDYLTFFEM